MPELPEVETIKRQLESEVLGAEIESIEVRENRCFEGGEWLANERIASVGRMGKYIFVKFSSGRGLVIHLKMTGRLILGESANLQVSKSASQQVSEVMFDYDGAKHTRVVMRLRDGRRIFYWDTRMFGYVKHVEDIEKQERAIGHKLGPEPWDLTDLDLMRKFKKTSRAIKDVILDQHILAGVGNIYANDGLWLAGVDPRRTAKSLRLAEVAKLRKSLCSVLERGLATGGASDNSYVDAYGEKGSYQNEFLTYRRAGEPCKTCGTLLVRIVVGGRGTWVCEFCQK